MSAAEDRRRELAVEYVLSKAFDPVDAPADYIFFRNAARPRLGIELAESATDWAAGHRAATESGRALREAVRKRFTVDAAGRVHVVTWSEDALTPEQVAAIVAVLEEEE